MPPLSPQTELLHSSCTSLDYEQDKAPMPLTYESSPPQERRNVTFATFDDVCEIPHIDDLSDEEINDVWMSAEDGAKIRKECQSIVLMMNKNSEKLTGVEIRGLEQHGVAHTEQRRAIQNLLYDAVDRIQSFQAEKGVDISHLIAEVCQKISAMPILAARRVATQDAIAAYV
eukprot:scaffold4703_cov108-Cylindrotheca_fusiformis.AAC.12